MVDLPGAMDTANGQMSLEERIQRLAQELQDIIFDFYVLTVPSGRTIDITTSYQAPKQLQIDRASRRTAAKHYYSTNAFVIHGFDKDSDIAKWLQDVLADPSFEEVSATAKWLRSLSADHSLMIETLSFPQAFSYMEKVIPELNLQFRYDLLIYGIKASIGVQLQPKCLEVGFLIAGPGDAGPRGKDVVVYGKRDELGTKLVELIIERARAEAPWLFE